MKDVCHYTIFKPTECTQLRVNPKVNYVQCRFILGNKCTILESEAGMVNRRGYICVG